MKNLKTILMGTALLLLISSLPALAQRDGWDRDSRYNHFFNRDQMVYISGEIVKIDRDHRPLTGMPAGLAIDVKTDDGKFHHVDVAPIWFTDFYKKKWDVSVGDEVDIRGSQTSIDGKPTVMAVWGRKADLALTVRSPKGAPVWDIDIADFYF